MNKTCNNTRDIFFNGGICHRKRILPGVGLLESFYQYREVCFIQTDNRRSDELFSGTLEIVFSTVALLVFSPGIAIFIRLKLLAFSLKR